MSNPTPPARPPQPARPAAAATSAPQGGTQARQDIAKPAPTSAQAQATRDATAAAARTAAARPSSAPAKVAMKRVRASELGYYGDKRRRPGDVFMVPQTLTGKWFDEVDPATPLKLTTSAAALKQAHDDILGGNTAGGPGDADEGHGGPADDDADNVV